MTLEESIYAALTSSADLVNLVGDRIYPTDQAPFDLPAPWIYYTLTDSNPEGMDLRGDYPRTKSGLEVDVLGKNYLHAKSIRNAVFNALHKYRGGQVRSCLWSGYQLTQIEEGYHFEITFSIEGSSANLVERLGTQARIVTSNNLFEVYPNGQQRRLQLNQNGGIFEGEFNILGSLFLNGQPVTAGGGGAAPIPCAPALIRCVGKEGGAITADSFSGYFTQDSDLVIGLAGRGASNVAGLAGMLSGMFYGTIHISASIYYFWIDNPETDWGIIHVNPPVINTHAYFTVRDAPIAGSGPTILAGEPIQNRQYGIQIIT